MGRSEAKEGEMKMESGMLVAEGLRGDPSGLSQTNINNETFAPSVLLFIPPLPLSLFLLSLSLPLLYCIHANVPPLLLFSGGVQRCGAAAALSPFAVDQAKLPRRHRGDGTAVCAVAVGLRAEQTVVLATACGPCAHFKLFAAKDQ